MDLPPLNTDGNASMRRARATAVDRGLERADPIDVLVGLLGDDSAAIRVLEMFQTVPDMIRTAATFLSAATWPDADAEDRIVDLARTEAARLGQDTAGSEHLLLALLRQPNSIAGGVLSSLGVTLDPAREAVRFIHGQVPDWQPPEPPADGLPKFASAPMTAVDFEPGEEPFSAVPAQVSPFAFDFDIGLSPLQRVVAIGQVKDAAGVQVEMIALEIRETGAYLGWRTRAAEERPVEEPVITVTDDVGTDYHLFPGSSSSSGYASSGETWIAPAPPVRARSLIIEVDSFHIYGGPFGPFRRPTNSILGPWRFEVALGD